MIRTHLFSWDCAHARCGTCGWALRGLVWGNSGGVGLVMETGGELEMLDRELLPETWDSPRMGEDHQKRLRG